MLHIVAGTAGHIDHGKTALVRALTGIDTDRLEEEKRRGISIDIGFAHLELLGQLRVAFVDVPGHERFIKNMLAGIGGIDLLMLVVAADSSIQQQTREHFEICRLLGIRKGFVALTKIDLVDPEIVELARFEVAELVRGSFLEGAPLVPVSSVTGQGLDDVRRTLAELAAQVTPKSSAGHFRLPVDRSFAMRGFGSVVTGTLLSGSVTVEDEIEIHPLHRVVRVRGVQVHGETTEKAVAGQRTALNLAGIEHHEIGRGMTLTATARFSDTKVVDCVFDLLPSAKALRHRAPVHFHAGTAEIEAELRRIETTRPLEPGARAYVRLVLREPAMLLPGDRFIVRMFSPVVTIGGGMVLDAQPPRKAALERLRQLDGADDAQRIAVFLSEAPLGVSLAGLVARTGLTEDAIRKHATALLTDWFIDASRVENARHGWREALAAFHRANPLLPGMPKEQLRGNVPPPVFEELLKREPLIKATGDVLHLASHKIAFKQDEEEALGKIEAAFERAGLRAPAVNEVLAASGVEANRARSLLQILLRNQKLVRISVDLVFHHTALATLRAMLAQQKGRRFGVGDFKDWTGISRKYAIPLLEMLDRERVTRRDGETRIVL